MRYSVYTSCAINYLPKARALAESLRRHQPDARLTLCLNDQIPPWLDLAAEPFDQIWLPEDLGYDRAWTFQHNVMELCTAVKGRALVRLMAEDPDALHLYLDPDVYVFDSLAPVTQMMEGASIGLVPHILCPEQTDIGVRLTEMSSTEHGIYNLGHLVVRADANGTSFARWWRDRLDAYCFDDRGHGLFTDQRWVDLVPAIFAGVRILRSPALDVASWNLAGREIRQNQPGDPGAFTVNGERLLTYHFSGTGPTGTHRQVREIFDPGNAATAEIERIYEAAIARNGQAALARHRSGLDHFDDATPISAGARKLYRDHADLRRAFPDPYACGHGQMSFLDWLRQNRPGLVDGLRLASGMIETAFDDLFDEDYYLATHPDAADAVARGCYPSAKAHYCAIGSRLFLDPNEFFVSSYYHDRAADHDPPVLRRGPGRREDTLLWHYLTVGLANRFEPIEFFDSGWYLRQYPDVQAAMRTRQVSTPLGHFLHYGSTEGRDPGPGFQGSRFMDNARDIHPTAQSGPDRGPFGALVRLGGVTGRIHVQS